MLAAGGKAEASAIKAVPKEALKDAVARAGTELTRETSPVTTAIRSLLITVRSSRSNKRRDAPRSREDEQADSVAMDGLVYRLFTQEQRAPAQVQTYPVDSLGAESRERRFSAREEQQRAGKEKFEVNFFMKPSAVWIPGANRGLRKSLAAKARECDSRESLRRYARCTERAALRAIGISSGIPDIFCWWGRRSGVFRGRAFHAFIGATIKK